MRRRWSSAATPARPRRPRAARSGGKDGADAGSSGAGGGGGKVQGADDPNALRAISRDVTVDRIVGDKWLVTKGLSAGDELIVEGLNRIKPGQPIRPVPAGSPPPAPPGGGKDAGATK